MDYQKAYKEALAHAREIHRNEEEKRRDMEFIFPELKESEDERIRKELIDIVKKSPITFAFEDKGKVLSWLEKQGEHANFLSKIQIGDKVTRNEAGILVNISQLNRVAKPAKRQGEQKLTDKIKPKFHEGADKVEPKFKVGDWVVNTITNDVVEQIIEVTNNEYICSGVLIVSFDNQHLLKKWTIQDAKDGDVLVCPFPKGYEAGGQIFIFKEINSRDYVDNCIEYYCRVCEGVFYENKNGYMGTTSSPLYPATKEQRDLLFQKMKEAGYEWDAEKKELKIIDWSKHIKYNPNAPSIIKEKSVWGEEDEIIYAELIKYFESLLNCLATEERHNENRRWLNWLKSLKQRIAP